MGKSTISMAIFNSYVCFPEGTYSIWFRTWVCRKFYCHSHHRSFKQVWIPDLTKQGPGEDCSSHPPNNIIVIGYHQQILTIYHLLIHEYTLIIITTMSGLQITHPRTIWISGWGNLLQELKRAEQQLDRFMELGVFMGVTPKNRRMGWNSMGESMGKSQNQMDDLFGYLRGFGNLHMNRTRKDQSQILRNDGPSSDGVRHMAGIQKLQCFYWPDGPLDTPKNGEVGTDHREFCQDFFNWGHDWPWDLTWSNKPGTCSLQNQGVSFSLEKDGILFSPY